MERARAPAEEAEEAARLERVGVDAARRAEREDLEGEGADEVEHEARAHVRACDPRDVVDELVVLVVECLRVEGSRAVGRQRGGRPGERSAPRKATTMSSQKRRSKK